MNIKDRLVKDMKDAMRSGDKLRLSVIRMLRAAVKDEEIKKGGIKYNLSDEETLEVLARAAKQRKDAIAQYKKAQRNDLVEKETKELNIIQEYLPKQLTEEEIKKIVKETIDEVGASSPRELGKVMKILMPKVKGLADGKLVNQIVREFLQ